jgi:Lon protease-like protein
MTGHRENQQPSQSMEAVVLLPEVIPLFPLPKTVLMPGELLPLHIFEPRYRQMAADVISSNRAIGMVAVLPGHESEQPGNPPVEQIGCAGFVAQHKAFDDGRYLLWLVGLERFRIAEELETATDYRQARVEFMPTEEDPKQLAGIQPLRSELRLVLPQLLNAEDETRNGMVEQLADVNDSQLVAIACQVLELPSERKQELLEAPTQVEQYMMLYQDLYAHMERTSVLGEIDPSELN